MTHCKLCKGNPANKPGSHIIPHFLLIRVDGVDGSKLRNTGVGSTITSSSSSTYLERDVSPEKWYQMLGEYSDDDIAKMGRNPSIVDYLVCKACEDRFGILENEYSLTLSKFKTEDTYQTNIEGGAALLFWMSVIWRMSVSNLYGFQLSGEESELLRNTLDQYMKLKFQDIDFDALYKDGNLNNLAYRLIRCPNYSDTNFTAIVCHPVDSRPYSIMIDEYLLFFYFNKSDIDKIYQDCFSFFGIVKHTKPNTLADGECIMPVREVDVQASIKAIIQKLKDTRLNTYNDLFDKIHREYVGSGNMPAHIKLEIMDEITSDQKYLGRKYTVKDVINSIAKVLHKY